MGPHWTLNVMYCPGVARYVKRIKQHDSKEEIGWGRHISILAYMHTKKLPFSEYLLISLSYLLGFAWVFWLPSKPIKL